MSNNSDESAEIRQLLDERAVFQCLQKIARGMDRFDRELYLSAFHPDAIFEAGVLVARAEDAFDAGLRMHEENQLSTLHYLMNHTCEINGDVAHAETYFQFVAHNRDGTHFATGGRYIDRLDRREGAWKVAFRHTILEWSAALSKASIPLFADAPDIHLNGMPSRSRDDPSYRRPFTNLRQLTDHQDPRDMTRPNS